MNNNVKTNNNFVFIIVIILILFLTFFIDDILDRLTNHDYINEKTNEVESSNLINGFILVSDKNAYIKLKNIKFYNFKKTINSNLIFNFEINNKIFKYQNLGVYIELFNSNQELIYKELFNPQNTSKKGIYIYNIQLNQEIYNDVFYAKVRTYNKSEKNHLQILTCEYTLVDDNIAVLYQISYQFLNQELKKYDVDKNFTFKEENAIVNKYKKELTKEKDYLSQYNIEFNYTENSLKYYIDLENKIDEKFNALYPLGTVPKIVKDNETKKEWICK